MTDLKFYFSFNEDGTTKYVQLPVAHRIAEVEHQSDSTVHSFHFGDLIATPRLDYPQRRHPMSLSTHEDPGTTMASYVSPESRLRDTEEYHPDMNVPPSLNAEPQRSDLTEFAYCSVPQATVSNSASVEGLTRSVVAMSPRIKESQQYDLTGSSPVIRVQDKDFCSGSSDCSLPGVLHEHGPTASTSLPAPTTDDSDTSCHASTASLSSHEASQYDHATSPLVSSEMKHDAESQSMLSDASISKNPFERDPSPQTDSGSVWTGIKTFVQDSKPPKENHLRVAIHGGKLSSSTIIFAQKKVKFKDAWTRSFILKAAPMVDHPPDFELPRGAGLLCPNDLFVCVDLSFLHKGDDSLSANTISSSTTSTSALLSSTASSRNDPLHWSDPSMSQYLRIWCWDFNLRVWQPIEYGCSRRITSYELVLSFYRNTFEPLWVTPGSLRKKDNHRTSPSTNTKARRKFRLGKSRSK